MKFFNIFNAFLIAILITFSSIAQTDIIDPDTGTLVVLWAAFPQLYSCCTLSCVSAALFFFYFELRFRYPIQRLTRINSGGVIDWQQKPWTITISKPDPSVGIRFFHGSVKRMIRGSSPEAHNRRARDSGLTARSPRNRRARDSRAHH